MVVGIVRDRSVARAIPVVARGVSTIEARKCRLCLAPCMRVQGVMKQTMAHSVESQAVCGAGDPSVQLLGGRELFAAIAHGPVAVDLQAEFPTDRSRVGREMARHRGARNAS